jgi:stage IV sporulation protein A
MTTEPKFVPDEAVKIKLDGTETLNVKLIDSVGYLVDGAIGAEENGEERMIKTPWSDEAMPFKKAAETGTKKVIEEHSTIGILVTTDGSITDIPRESYVPAEERIVKELKNKKKPFAIVLNSSTPENESTRKLAESLEEKYGAPTALVNLKNLSAVDAREILALVLSSFPVKELVFNLPEWYEALPNEHTLYKGAINLISDFSSKVERLGDIEKCLTESGEICASVINAGDGIAEFNITSTKEKYYETLSEVSGIELKDEKSLFETVSALAKTDKEFKKIESALSDVRDKGYGIVMPSPEEMELDEPKMQKTAGGFGVKLSAKANSIHMIRAELKTELCPTVGTEEQTDEVVKYLAGEYEEDKEKIWESNMFGKSIYDLVKDGMNAKLINLPDDSREKLSETLERVVNEGANGLICILL